MVFARKQQEVETVFKILLSSLHVVYPKSVTAGKELKFVVLLNFQEIVDYLNYQLRLTATFNNN